MLKYFTLLSIFTFALFAENALVCKLINEDDIRKIKCKYNTVSKEYDRNITIAWSSPSAPQDDRFKTVLLPAYNISIYDYRYFDGRAEGSWTVSATDVETGMVTSTHFVKEDLIQEAQTVSPEKSSMAPSAH